MMAGSEPIGQPTYGVGPYATTRRVAPWFQAGLLVLLIGLLYYEILARLVMNWYDDPNFSHGFFVPAFSTFVIWLKWKRLSALPTNPSWLGLAAMAGALGVLVVGVLGAELFLSRSSFVLLLGGLVIYFLGWGWFGKVIFPWAFLFLAIPIPAIIFNHISLPLQFLASRFATSLLAFLNVPVHREGNIIQLPAMVLEVVQACSGIRSLVSLGTLAIIYGYFLEPKLFRRLLLVIAAVPIGILTNGLRVVGTGLLVQYWDTDKARGFFHTFEGWLLFVVSLLMLFSIHSLMRLVDRLSARGHP